MALASLHSRLAALEAVSNAGELGVLVMDEQAADDPMRVDAQWAIEHPDKPMPPLLVIVRRFGGAAEGGAVAN